jgi:hypothetical protein
MCSKASNPSDLMQHNVPAAIFYMAQYSVCGCWSALLVRRVFRPCGFSLTLPHAEHIVAKHNTMHYARVCSEHLPCFGEMFQWRKSFVCFGALICKFGVCRHLFHSRHHLLCLCRNRWQQYILFIFIL